MPFPMEQINDGSIADKNFRALARDMNPPVPQARVFNSANIATTTAVVKVLTFDSERWDEGSLHSTSANTDRLVAPITGLYFISADIQWASNATGLRLLRLVYSNGAVTIRRDIRPAVNGDVTEQSVSTTYRLAAGEYVTVEALQTSGGNLNVLAALNSSPEFEMHRVGGYVNQGV